MRSSTNSVLILAFALAAGVVGCGDDDSGGGTGGTSGSGGSGATSGSGGSGGTSGSGGGGATMCGGNACAEFVMPMIPDAGMSGGLLGGALPIDLTPVSCCTGAGMAVCGVNNSTLLGSNCLPRDVVGEPSTECAPQSIGGFVDLPGCCRFDGKCGLSGNLMGTDLGVGCAETVELYTALMGGLAGSFITGPAWTGGTCTYVGSTMDAGTGNDSGI